MASHIERRKFLATLGGAAVAWPLAAPAQQPKMAIIGIIVTGNASPEPFLEGFRVALRAAGLIHDRNPNNYTLPVDTRRPLGCDYCKSPNYSSSEAGSFQFSQGPAMPNALIALHSKLPAYWRERRCVQEKLARGDTPDPCMAPLPPGGTSKFSWCRRLLAEPDCCPASKLL
jgi:hypothetical protein